MLTTIVFFFLFVTTHVLKDHISFMFLQHVLSALLETCRTHGLSLDAELVLAILDLLTAETRLKLSLVRCFHTILPGGSVLLTLTLLMLCQTHVHVLAVRRAVFGDGDDEPDDEEENFNPFEFEYGDIRVYFSDSDAEEEDEDDDDEDEEGEHEDGQGEDMFQDEIGMNGSFLSVLIGIAMVSLVIQELYSNKEGETNKNVTTEAT